MPRRAVLAAALLVLPATLALSSLASAQSASEGIIVAPARVEATATPGISYGPFGLTNGSSLNMAVKVFPVLIGQARDGGFLVRDDPASLAQAKRFVGVDRTRFDLAPGASQNASGRLQRRTKDQNFYGGVLFRAIPRAEPGTQIQAIYQLNAALLLRPPPDRQKIRIASEGIRAEQAPGGRLRLVLALRNAGNTDVTPEGTIRVRSKSGKVVATHPLEAIQVLPGFTVDVPALIEETLPAGKYTLEAGYTAGGKLHRARDKMVLFGPNEVRSVDAQLAGFPTPDVTEGEPAPIDASFENTGNIPYTPSAEVVAIPVSAQGKPGKPGEAVQLMVEEAAPGEQGAISGQIDLPASSDQYELRLVLREGERELDSRSVSVTPQPEVSFLTRAGNFMTDHAAVLVGLLLIALVAVSIAFIAYVRRR